MARRPFPCGFKRKTGRRDETNGEKGEENNCRDGVRGKGGHGVFKLDLGYGMKGPRNYKCISMPRDACRFKKCIWNAIKSRPKLNLRIVRPLDNLSKFWEMIQPQVEGSGI